ncbi:hypothetical protein CTAM01_17036 [Colletotrichum tamarilloi]|uniref:C2H2-type domain-containing protein n=1 Tax=Colletotrichum tamarilloi TaxID=1209934 RepID=A0ABQ9QGT3_9PEZI|nr:uncharacterized protein CTAM01_17036 [Colletotrichum tamarilloi]KAK1466160.1 hypothetical protein CTAM01_17036 [Colletotrichum tamarilloi]
MRFFLLGVNVLNDEEEEETAQGATHTRLEAGPEATGRSDCRTGQLEEHESEGLSEPSSDAVSKATVEWQRTSPRGLLLLSRSGSALARSFISAEEQSLSARPKVSPTVFLSCTVVGCNQVFSDEREWAEHTRGRLCLPEEARSKYARGMRSEAAPRVVRSPSCPYPGCGKRYATPGGLKTHQLQEHGGGSKRHQCLQCKRVYRRPEGLEKHRRVAKGMCKSWERREE